MRETFWRYGGLMRRVAIGFVGPLSSFTDGAFETTPEVATILEEKDFIRRAPLPLRMLTGYLPAAGRSMAECQSAARQVQRTLTSRQASAIHQQLGDY